METFLAINSIFEERRPEPHGVTQGARAEQSPWSCMGSAGCSVLWDPTAGGEQRSQCAAWGRRCRLKSLGGSCFASPSWAPARTVAGGPGSA